MKSFVEKLLELNQKNIYPLHMPGHKRRMTLPNPYSIDITEIDGYDNLHAPEGMIKDLEDRVSSMYDENHEFIDKSYVLVNGSTCGIYQNIAFVYKFMVFIIHRQKLCSGKWQHMWNFGSHIFSYRIWRQGSDGKKQS